MVWYRFEQNRRAPPFTVEALVIQRDPGFADVRIRDTAALAVHSADLE